LVTMIPPYDPNVSQNNHAPWESPPNLEEQKKQVSYSILKTADFAHSLGFISIYMNGSSRGQSWFLPKAEIYHE
jgi:hypothetical protein